MSFVWELIQLSAHRGASHLKLPPIEDWNVIVVFLPVAQLGPFLVLASMLAGRKVSVWLVEVGLSLSQ